MNTPTPRTDAATYTHESYDHDGEHREFKYVFPEEMKKLERELTAANSKIAELKGLFEKYSQHDLFCGTCGQCMCGLDAALKKVREM